MRLGVVTLVGLGMLGVGGAIGAAFYLFSLFPSSWFSCFAPDSACSPTPIEGLGFLVYIMLALVFIYGGLEVMIAGAVLTIVGGLHDLVKWRDQQS